MERKYPNLCKPITLGRTTFRNRMFSAPMGGTDITNDGCIGPKRVLPSMSFAPRVARLP